MCNKFDYITNFLDKQDFSRDLACPLYVSISRSDTNIALKKYTPYYFTLQNIGTLIPTVLHNL